MVYSNLPNLIVLMAIRELAIVPHAFRYNRYSMISENLAASKYLIGSTKRLDRAEIC